MSKHGPFTNCLILIRVGPQSLLCLRQRKGTTKATETNRFGAISINLMRSTKRRTRQPAPKCGKEIRLSFTGSAVIRYYPCCTQYAAMGSDFRCVSPKVLNTWSLTVVLSPLCCLQMVLGSSTEVTANEQINKITSLIHTHTHYESN